MKKNCRIIALTDASHNRHTVSPSMYAGLFYISDFDEDFDQNVFTNDHHAFSGDDFTDRLINASLIYWRTRVVKR